MKSSSLTKLLETANTKGNSNVKIKKSIAVKMILKSLFYEGTLSNLEFSKFLVMTSPSVTSLLNELMEWGVIEMRGQGTSSGGRKPTLYGLVKEFSYIVGVDMDQYYTSMAIFNMHHEIVTSVKTFSLKLSNDRKILNKFLEELHDLIDKSGIDKKKILGIGISIPGFVNTKLGVNYTFFNCSEKPLRQLISEEFKLPVFLENDASSMALGESKFGLAKDSNNALVIKYGWGVGLGMILNGRIYRGNSGLAGEFSHIPIAENGILCFCGKEGCLETETSATVLSKMVKEGIQAGRTSMLRTMIKEDPARVEVDLILEAANAGDQFSIQMLSTLGYKLGKGIAILVHLFNPGVIIIGGRLSKAGQYIIVPIQQAMHKYAIPRLKDNTEIVVSNLGEKEGLLGAVSLVVDNIFDEYAT